MDVCERELVVLNCSAAQVGREEGKERGGRSRNIDTPNCQCVATPCEKMRCKESRVGRRGESGLERMKHNTYVTAAVGNHNHLVAVITVPKIQQHGHILRTHFETTC